MSREVFLRATGKSFTIGQYEGLNLLDSVPDEPLISIGPEDGRGEKIPLTIRGSDWLGEGFRDCPEIPSIADRNLSAGELLDAMLESDPDEVLLAVSAWLGVHAGRVRG